jgi:type VI secretion system secreted protein VgrG
MADHDPSSLEDSTVVAQVTSLVGTATSLARNAASSTAPDAPTMPSAGDVVQRVQSLVNAATIAQGGGASPAATAHAAAGALAGALSGVGGTVGEVAQRMQSFAGLASSVAGVASSLASAHDATASPLPAVTWSLRLRADEHSVWPVVEGHFTEALSAPYSIALQLLTDQSIDDFEAMLGERVVLCMARGAQQREVHGIVREITDAREHRGRTLGALTVVPALALLDDNLDSAVFLDRTVPQVVHEVVRDALRPYDADVRTQLVEAYPTREMVCQYGESDLAFVSRLLDRDGISYRFEQTHTAEQVVLSDQTIGAPAIDTDDGETVPWHQGEGDTHATEGIHRLGRVRRLGTNQVALRHHDWTRPERPQHHQSTAPRETPRQHYGGHQQGVLHRYDADAGTYGAHHLERRVAVETERLATVRALREGEGNVLTFEAGKTFVLHGSPGLDARYLLTRVMHHYEAPEVLHGDQSRDAPTRRYHNRFEVVAGDVPYRTPTPHPWPQVSGVQTALVVGPDGEAVHTDEHGRIKVQFHWDREGQRNERSACWVRVTQGWSGDRWGTWFLPRVGTEVTVLFEHGDPDRPIVTGSVYNGRHRAPFTQPDERTRTGLRTHTIGQDDHLGEGYNELSFEDRAGAEEVRLRAQRDLNEQVLHDHTLTVQRHQREAVHGDQSIAVGHDRQKHIDRHETTTVGGNRTETVAHNEQVTVHGHREVHVDQNDTLTVGGTHRVEVTGNVNERYAARRETTVHSHDALTVEAGAKTTTVHGAYDITVDDRFRVTRGASTVLVDQNIAGQTDGTITLSAQGNFVRIEPGGHVSVSARQRLTLACGGARIELTHDGKVTVTGSKHVQLASSASTVTVKPEAVEVNAPTINASADGAHEISGAIVRVN